MSNHVHILILTGSVPISHIMRKILTGYGVKFNRRYNGHGKLFQNRYISILPQEDLYLKDLVRYIFLNLLRAGVVSSLGKLDKYPWVRSSCISEIYEEDVSGYRY